MSRTSLLVALALAACGDSGVTSASASASATGTDSDSTTATSTTASTGTSNSTSQPTDGGTMDQTDSASTTVTTSTATDSGSTTDPTTGTTTMGVMTTTDGTSTDTTIGPDTTDTDTGTSTDGTSTTTDGTSTTTDGTSTTSTTTDTTDTTNTTGNPEPGPCDCPDIEVPLDDGIFVLSDNAELWKYFPETNDFLELGSFNCGGQTNTFSMAVDRKGFAWVMLNNPQGDIWKIDVTNPTLCTDPGYNPGQMGVGYFGMAFVSNNQNDQCDKLYGNSFNGFGGFSEGPNIGSFIGVDPMTLQLDIISPSNFNGAEMSGTGDGRVFSFGGVNPSKLIERDKATGDVISTFPLPNLPLTNAFAFAFFAGDFYFFTESANPSFSKVTHLDYDDSDNDGQQQLTTVNNNAPIRIVGAGVSTCAPFLPM